MMAKRSRRPKRKKKEASKSEAITERIGPEITVVGPDGPPSAELLEFLADFLLDLVDEEDKSGLPPKTQSN